MCGTVSGDSTEETLRQGDIELGDIYGGGTFTEVERSWRGHSQGGTSTKEEYS